MSEHFQKTRKILGATKNEKKMSTHTTEMGTILGAPHQNERNSGRTQKMGKKRREFLVQRWCTEILSQLLSAPIIAYICCVCIEMKKCHFLNAPKIVIMIFLSAPIIFVDLLRLATW